MDVRFYLLAYFEVQFNFYTLFYSEDKPTYT